MTRPRMGAAPSTVEDAIDRRVAELLAACPPLTDEAVEQVARLFGTAPARESKAA